MGQIYVGLVISSRLVARLPVRYGLNTNTAALALCRLPENPNRTGTSEWLT